MPTVFFTNSTTVSTSLSVKSVRDMIKKTIAAFKLKISFVPNETIPLKDDKRTASFQVLIGSSTASEPPFGLRTGGGRLCPSGWNQ